MHMRQRFVQTLAAFLCAGGIASASDFIFRGQTLNGTAANEEYTGVSVLNSGGVSQVYFSGNTSAQGMDGMAVRYDINAGSYSPLLQWNRLYPNVVNGDSLSGVTATSSGVYFVGSSYSQTIDTVGGKENKGITVNIPNNGVGLTWQQQTPGAPGAFTYGGSETLLGVSTGVSSSQTVLYATGFGQSGFSNGGRAYLSKLDTSGNVLWTRTDSVVVPTSVGYAVTSVGSDVYLAGLNADSGQSRGYIKKYDDLGNLQFALTTVPGVFHAISYDALTNSIFLVGRTAGGANTDFLLERRDTSGNILWTRTFDRSGGNEVLYGVTMANGVYVAVGSTTGNTAGGMDGILFEFNPTNGDMITSTLWGGAADDSFRGIVMQDDVLHIAAATNSFGAGGSDAAYVLYSVPEPGTWMLICATVTGAGAIAWRRRRQAQLL